MENPVCMVAGVGPGTGSAITRRFTAGGYRVAMIGRDSDRLANFESEIEGATAFPCDMADLDGLIETVGAIKKDLGPPSIVIHNAARSVRGAFLDLDPDDLEKNFRVNVTALAHLARVTLPAMLEAGKGTILVTGNTSATRGKTNWGYFAATKAAQRILAESIAREFGPQGIHVAYFIIDAIIDTPRMRTEWFPDAPDEFFVQPSGIADEMYHVAHQDPSAWSFRVELRPYGEVW